MSNYNSNDVLEMFIFEFSQLINQLEDQILANEKMNSYTDESVNEIFRIMHTLKGSSAMMGFENIATLAHCMEDLFYCIRNGQGDAIDYSELADILLECVDLLKVEELRIRAGHPLGDTNKELINRINELIPEQCQKENNKKAPVSGDILLVAPPLEETDDQNSYFYRARIYFEDGIGMENMRAFSIIHDLEGIQKDINYLPTDIVENMNSAEIIQNNGFIIFLKSDCSYETIENILKKTVFLKSFELHNIPDEVEYQNQLNITFKNESQKPQSVKDRESNSKGILNDIKSISTQQSIISVNVSKLDKLMDLVGEMVIAEAMVIENSDLAGLTLNNFYKAARHLNKITTEIQDTVMAIRMVPLSATFHKMYRIVRDMNKKLGKEAELNIIGEDTEVDKNIIEHISDPLMHLIRNSIDHGIEMPEERIKKGKPKNGVVTIEAKNSGSDVIIQIKDDGIGLDRDKILKKAKDKNLLNVPESEITNKELFGLILFPGFSTNDEITEFSGRGVGMDVVSSNINEVGGSISVDSIADQGTTITLKIPLTLAIIDGMNIKVANSYYTIPTINAIEFFRPERKNIIVDPNDNEMIMVRGECYPILKLYEQFEIQGAKTEYTDGIIVMVEEDDNTFCIFADELLGQQQVVVKSLPDYVRKTKKIHGLSGCTLLGNGGISLILDIPALSKFG